MGSNFSAVGADIRRQRAIQNVGVESLHAEIVNVDFKKKLNETIKLL